MNELNPEVLNSEEFQEILKVSENFQNDSEETLISLEKDLKGLFLL